MLAVAVALATLWRLRYWLLWRLAASRLGDRLLRSALTVADPTFGDRMGVFYRLRNIPDGWEDFLDALRFRKNSPIREHVRQLFGRDDLDEQLRALFDLVAGGRERLLAGDVARVSRGIQGHVHVLCKSAARVRVAAPTHKDMQWIDEEFELVFPPERPLERGIFPAFLKLVLLRRIVRTLVEAVGMEQLRDGMGSPLVVDISVDIGGGVAPFRIHTVAPSSAPCGSTGENLTLIEDAEEETEDET